jgi:circadian clock protein KaiC
VQNAGAVGFLATDVPYGSSQLSRYGVEETVVDGVLLLTSTEEGAERQRYVEVYKLRNTAHLKGRHSLLIGRGGIHVFPRYADGAIPEPPPAIGVGARMPSGTPGLDARMGGGLLRRSATIVAGSAGVGKSTLGLQFVLEGARRGEHGIIFTLEEGPEQLMASADALELPLREAVRSGKIDLVYLSRPDVRASQLLSVMGDRVREHEARRLVLDGVTHLGRGSDPSEALGETLHKLVRKFKELGATSMLTLETSSLHSAEEATESGFSPLADNILSLRYAITSRGDLYPVVTIVKTRGSAHDTGTYRLILGLGGLGVETGGSRGLPALERTRRRARAGARGSRSR